MDFTFTEEQTSLREATRDLLARHHAAPVPGDAEHDPKLWQALAELGALGLPFAEDVGGMGAGPVEAVAVALELGKAGVRAPYAESLTATQLLCSDEGFDDLATAAIEGTRLVVPALYEPSRAWSPTPVGVTATAGSLAGIRAAIPYAAASPAVVTTARVGDAVEIYALDAPTFAGATVDLAGQEARAIPGGAAHIQRAVNLGTLVLAAEALGAMEAALGLTVDYLKTRKQFGVPLMRFQTLTQRAADMYTSLELARSAVYFLAMTLAENPDDDTAVSRVKVIVGKAGRLVGQEAVQLHGGIGMTAEYAVGHHLARITAIEHTYGDTRFHLAKLARHVKDNDSRDLLS